MGGPRRASWPEATALVVASGVLYARCFPPTSPSLGLALAWLAPAPLFLALRDRGPLAGAALAGIWAASATACVVHWIVPTLHQHYGWSLTASVAFLGGLAVVSAAPFFSLAFGLVRLGSRGRLSPALFAAAFVSAELLRGRLGLRSPWAALGATQVEAERIRQIADLTGIYGVGGLVAFVSAALAGALVGLRPQSGQGPPRRDLASAAAAAIALSVALVYGQWRAAALEAVPAPSDAALEVALVQGNVRSELRWRRSHASRVLRRYGSLTREALAAAGPGDADAPRPDLVIWPENAIQTPLGDPTYGRPVLGLARAVPLLIGAPRHAVAGDVASSFNSAHLIEPDGHVVSYDKRRLLPFGESNPLGDWLALEPQGDLDAGVWGAGRHPGVFSVAGHRLGVLICLEALHPDLAREVVRDGAGLLVNLSNDGWLAGAGAREQHFAQVAFRAIEMRRPLVRATPTGITAVVSATGEVEARLPPGTQGVLRARVVRPPGPPSLYAQVGDVFALGCLLACAAPGVRIAGLALANRRPAHGTGPRSSASAV